VPVTINGFGVSACGARGYTRWHKSFIADADCDAVVCFVALFIPMTPLKAIHAFDWGGSFPQQSYREIPIRMDGGLFLLAFLRRITLGLPFLSLLLGAFTIFSIRDKMHVAVSLLLALFALVALAAAILGQVWLRWMDRGVSDIRYLLGRHKFGSSDPATWTRELLVDVQSPRQLFGTRTYAEAVPHLLKRGAYSQAMWAARLTCALEGRREGEALTRSILHDPGARAALERVRSDPERWAEVMGGTAGVLTDPTAEPAPATGYACAPKSQPAGAFDDLPSLPRSPRPSSSAPTLLILMVGGGLLLLLLAVVVVAVVAMQGGGGGGPNAGPRRNGDRVVARVVPQPPAPPGVAGKTTVDLIPLLNPARDTIHGRWTIAQNMLHCPEGNFVPRIEIPYQPPEEYDFLVTFSQSEELRNGISLVMPNPNGGSFFWFLANEEGRAFGFHANPDKMGHLPEPIRLGTAYTTVVQVRKGGVTGLLNGRVLLSLKTDFRNLTCDGWRKIRDTKHLAVACDDPTVFHYVRVVEITGSGKKTR
jgi:hypothetical protein